MEQHPVPQNVTSFQFRLVGDMTLKQMGYLAAGSIFGYIIIKMPLPSFITWPVGLLVFLTGIGFAFVPIENRPMDVWVFSFFKRIYSPTQYIWRKGGSDQVVLQQPFPISVVAALFPGALFDQGDVPSIQDRIKGIFSPKKQGAVSVDSQAPAGEKIDLLSGQTPAGGPQTQTSANTEEQKLKETEEKAKQLQQKIAALQQEQTQKDASQQRFIDLQKQLSDALNEQKKMQQELTMVRDKLQQKTRTSTTPQEVQEKKSKEPTVRIISPDAAKKAGLPTLTTHPNVVTGIIKDAQGGLLPNVLVTIRDKENVPLRALKTNKLGQFAASTPLNNGEYFLEIEDPRKRFAFDRIKVTLAGKVVAPIEILAKSEKQINRARLEKQLFGDQTT